MRDVVSEICLPDKVLVFDTTLRDGEQTPGVSFTVNEKKIIAERLAKLGVNIIEAGMPVVSKGEEKAIREIVKLGLNTEICALTRTNLKEIDLAIDCGVDRVHTFIATSDLHLKEKLKMTREQALNSAVEAVSYTKEHGLKVEFSAEDATRSDLNFLKEIYGEVGKAGVNVINIPDTVGCTTPRAYAYLTKQLMSVVKSDVIISVHTHNDFNLAVANSLAAVEMGAKQIHVAVNGIGERAGNASLEEAVMSLIALYGISTSIKTEHIFETSKLIENLSGIKIPPNKAIVGDNAFRHESGIHAHAVLVDPRTYEPITPEVIGRKRSEQEISLSSIVVGKHTGRHSLKAKLDGYGYIYSNEQFEEIMRRIKELGDKGKNVTDIDLQVIADDIIGRVSEEEQFLKLKELLVVTGLHITPTATVRIEVGQEEKLVSDMGVGPVDAACNALQKAVKAFGEISLVEYNLEAITGGTEALGFVTVKIKDHKNKFYIARAANEDIVSASVQALINAVNRKLAYDKNQKSL
ncbi:MAG: 2-isopropylmalate synthase [Candidatus Jordarchaeum sp.]|uniref:2-isopropylmalate synthase n=1 Tax=Candidatus Jordarchaeum sp. TaxID=2823881 RepID=UPI00404A29CF